MPDGVPETDDLERVLRELRARVGARRDTGLTGPELESDLHRHFARLLDDRPAPPPVSYEELARLLRELAGFEFSPRFIDPASTKPGGRFAHRFIGAAVSRQVQGVLEQSQTYAREVSRTLEVLSQIVSTLGHEYEARVLQQLDDLQERTAELQRSINELRRDREST